MAGRRGGAAGVGIIETDADIRAGVKALRRSCIVLRGIHDGIGDPPLRRRPDGFAGLVRIIVGQQLSIASADAIWRRVEDRIVPLQADALLGLPEAELRLLGLSAPKIRTLRATAHAAVEGRLDLEALAARSEEDVRAALTAVHGIGPWTADIYLMFCLGRRDAFAPGDLALQEAVRMAFAMAERPGTEEITAIAERWRPWRAVAARLLWAYYGATRRNGRAVMSDGAKGSGV